MYELCIAWPIIRAATYFRDLVRSVSRSCEDRRHSFVVVDAPVLRAEQLRELTAAGQVRHISEQGR